MKWLLLRGKKKEGPTGFWGFTSLRTHENSHVICSGLSFSPMESISMGLILHQLLVNIGIFEVVFFFFSVHTESVF